VTASVQKERNQRKLLEACASAGLPASHYTLNADGTILHVIDGALVRPFGCSSRSFPAQIDQAVREIATIAAKRMLRIGRSG
jgi:hypothetical protein